MPDSAPEQGAPSQPARTYYQVITDPALSCQARVVFAMMHPILEMRGVERFSLEEIAAVLGYSVREASRSLSELEGAGVIVSRLGGRGKGKVFAIGPAVRGGVDAIDARNVPEDDDPTPSSVRGEIEAPARSTQQMRFEMHNAGGAVISRSRAIARGKRSLQDPALDLKDDDEIAREAALSSSSLFQKLTEAGLSRSNAQRCIEQHGANECERQLALLPARLEYAERRGRPVRDPGAWLLKAISEGWGDPPRFVPSDWQMQIAERQMQSAPVIAGDRRGAERETPKRKSAEEIAAERAAALDNAKTYFANLPADVQAALENRARAAAAKFHSEAAFNSLLLGEINKHATLQGVQL